MAQDFRKEKEELLKLFAYTSLDSFTIALRREMNFDFFDVKKGIQFIGREDDRGSCFVMYLRLFTEDIPINSG